MIRSRFFTAILMVAVSLLSGCGNSDLNGVANGSLPQNNFFMGRVLMERPVEGATVTIEDLQGQTLYNLQSDAIGLFMTHGALPQDFRIKVQRPGEDTVHAREIRGGYRGGTMYVNPATTLVSRHMQSRGSSLEEAEAAIKARFEIPSDFELNWITNSATSPFSPRRFYELAAENGGVESFYQLLLEDIATQELAANQSSSAIDTIVGEVGKDILGDTVSVIDAGIFGAVTQALGLNIGTTGALNEIEGQLNDVLADLAAIENELSLDSLTGIYNTDRGFMLDALNTIEGSAQAIVDFLDSTNSDYGDLLNNIAGFQATLNNAGSMTVIYEYLLGRNVDNIIFTYAEIVQASMFSNIGGAYLHYPFRRNAITNQMRDHLRNYENYLALGINAFAESAHIQIPIAGPLGIAERDIDTALFNLQNIRAQVPELMPSDEVGVDMGGVMWFLAFQEIKSYATAQEIADNFSVGPYDDWGLPGRGDLERLALTLVGEQVPDDDNDSQWRTAFSNFGFDLTYYGKYLDSEAGVPFNAGCSFYAEGTGNTVLNTNILFWQGVISNPATGVADEATFLLQRGFAGAPERDLAGGLSPLAYGSISTFDLQGQPVLEVQQDNGQLTARARIYALYNPGFFTEVLFGNGPIDVTEKCAWVSSNTDVATVSNLPLDPDDPSPPGPIGRITWHPPTDGSTPPSVEFTANFWGMPVDGQSGLLELTQSITVAPPTNLTLNQTSLQVLPQQATVDATNSGTLDFYATAFYEDGQYEDVTDDCTFVLTDSSNNVIDSRAEGGGFITTNIGQLNTNPSLMDPDLTVTVTFTNPTTGQSFTQTSPLTATVNLPTP